MINFCGYRIKVITLGFQPNDFSSILNTRSTFLENDVTKEEQERFALEEIQNSKRIFKSATPKYTLDWYVKWAASILILISLAMRSAGPEYRFYDLAFGVVGIALWLWVSMLWKDRALILLNGVSLFMLMTALFKDML